MSSPPPLVHVGMMGAMIRHMKSLRYMERDNGWIHTLLEEAENERMHLLTFLELRRPGPLFRAMVMGGQGESLSITTARLISLGIEITYVAVLIARNSSCDCPVKVYIALRYIAASWCALDERIASWFDFLLIFCAILPTLMVVVHPTFHNLCRCVCEYVWSGLRLQSSVLSSLCWLSGGGSGHHLHSLYPGKVS